jgi:hypothetical protein
MGIKTVADVRSEIPLQKDGRTELQELAAALSQHVEQRHRTRGEHTLELVPEPERYDLAATPEPLPTRAPEARANTVSRGVRRAVPLAFAAALTAIIGTAGWSSAHHDNAPRSAAVHQPAPQTALTLTAPITPAEWGAAAHQRLSKAGRPVDVFACQGAYAADAAIATADVLPPATTHPEIWQQYLATCLSDMSGASVGHSA